MLIVTVILVAKVFRLAFWLKAYGHECCKRTLIWSTSPAIRGFFGRRLRKALLKSKIQTAIKYRDSSGRTRWKGSPQLKSTQCLGYNSTMSCSSKKLFQSKSMAYLPCPALTRAVLLGISMYTMLDHVLPILQHSCPSTLALEQLSRSRSYARRLLLLLLLLPPLPLPLPLPLRLLLLLLLLLLCHYITTTVLTLV